jgi:hypothetical protein
VILDRFGLKTCIYICLAQGSLKILFHNKFLMKNNIKKIPTEFVGKGEVKGFDFRQLKRDQKACLYLVDCEGSLHYEVFKIVLRHIPRSEQLYEAYPKANSFGIWAWTYTDLETAFLKFKELDKKGGLS